MGNMDPTPACRIYAILARDGRSAVVFRRGPSKEVLVLRWWLDDDRIELGQWFRGRIYERRCDLSPDGDLLLAFLAKWSGPHETWTALSRTPYLTALAYWPKGDAWGGGGVFEGARAIGLNYREIPAVVSPSQTRGKWHPLGAEAPPSPLPKAFTVAKCADWAGMGEDNPIEMHRMMRAGWRHVQAGQTQSYGAVPGYSWMMAEPEIIERPSPLPQSKLLLRRLLRAIGQRDGPWYVEDFAVQRPDGTELRLFAACSWADWDNNGNLLLAMDGRLYRLAARDLETGATDPLADANIVADLRDLRFRPQAAPDWARQLP